MAAFAEEMLQDSAPAKEIVYNRMKNGDQQKLHQLFWAEDSVLMMMGFANFGRRSARTHRALAEYMRTSEVHKTGCEEGAVKAAAANPACVSLMAEDDNLTPGGALTKNGKNGTSKDIEEEWAKKKAERDLDPFRALRDTRWYSVPPNDQDRPKIGAASGPATPAISAYPLAPKGTLGANEPMWHAFVDAMRDPSVGPKAKPKAIRTRMGAFGNQLGPDCDKLKKYWNSLLG